ncbi:T9SS type A sorting domain-containing protein [Cesiribacter andamanensis]|nr:T9SS type A sorting domain-containing protein [Cesiribacter andamanensis]
MLLLQGYTAQAQTSLQVELYKPGAAIARIQVAGAPSAEPMTIRVKSAEGYTLYKDKSTAERYVKLINFENLAKGTYLVDLEQGQGVSRKVVVKDDAGLTIQDGGSYFHNSITFQDADKKLLVRFSNKLDQQVTIRIVDRQGNIVHEESNIKANAYANKFNLAGLQHGTYKVSLISGSYSSTKSIRI